MFKKFFKNLKPIIILFKNLKKFKKIVKKAGPWYQTFNFFFIFQIYAEDKNKNKISSFSSDRGIRKWNKFIAPNLPFNLKNKRILEVGTNAGLYLFYNIIKNNAKYCCGIEPSVNYINQGLAIKTIYETIYQKSFPVDFIKEKMENLDFDLLPNFDVCMFLLSIYHINEKGRKRENLVFEDQVSLLKKAAKSCKYFIFLANGIEDEGRGKGIASLNKIIKKSKLKIIKINHINHSRGYLLIAKSKYNFLETIKLQHTCNKYFKKPNESSEFEYLEEYLKNKEFNYKNTAYYLLRTKKINWKFPNIANFPKNLDNMTEYWFMPWAKKIKEYEDIEKIKFDKDYIFNFYNFIKNKKKYKNHDPIEGYLLINKQNKKRFIYTDGNHRMAIYMKLNQLNKNFYKEVKISIIQTITEKNLFKNYITKNLINQKKFTKKDVKRWFLNSFKN